MKRNLLLILIFSVSTIIFHGVADAMLSPEEIVVLVNGASPESVSIGELYVKVRNIPSSHIIKLNVPIKEGVERKDYDEFIAWPVRRAIHELFEKGDIIRCVVTTYGIPLRINVKPLIITEEIDQLNTLKKKKQKDLSVLRAEKKKNEVVSGGLDKKIIRVKKQIDNINLKIGRLRGEDTVASVDSELALLLVPDYPLAGPRPNPEFLRFKGNRPVYFGQVLMVSRLDASTPELVKGLIHTASEVENKGLSGKIYLDARGKTGEGPYSKFDEEIRRTAQILRRGLMTVVLDDQPELFEDAPDAALYCGWYRLGKYKDAFRWAKGAVGYHVASAEAVSLHNPNARYWAKSMIENGVIATLGPVAEPYLQAFPPPSLFFPLLMSGKYTLAEVFAMTNPYLSWRMVLIGDPLYNPFKNTPAYVSPNLPPPPS